LRVGWCLLFIKHGRTYIVGPLVIGPLATDRRTVGPSGRRTVDRRPSDRRPSDRRPSDRSDVGP